MLFVLVPGTIKAEGKTENENSLFFCSPSISENFTLYNTEIERELKREGLGYTAWRKCLQFR